MQIDLFFMLENMPLSRTFYVATDCGLAVSTDNGATFVTTPLDPANPKLFSVFVVNRTSGVVKVTNVS